MAAPVLASNGLDNIIVETGINARQALSLLAAALAGNITVTGSTVSVIAAGGINTRITATSSQGNRTVTGLNPPV